MWEKYDADSKQNDLPVKLRRVGMSWKNALLGANRMPTIACRGIMAGRKVCQDIPIELHREAAAAKKRQTVSIWTRVCRRIGNLDRGRKFSSHSRSFSHSANGSTGLRPARWAK
jgi:hypothetical protein